MRGKLHELYVVVHQRNPKQAYEQTRNALSAGADGVFLINHYGPGATLFDTVDMIRDGLGRAPWVGINLLDLGALQAAKTLVSHPLADEIDGLWTDNAGVVEINETGNQPFLKEVDDALTPWWGRYFGGVAFKYQRRVDDLEAAARIGAHYLDVVCTSGEGTGHAADLEKLRRIREGAGDGNLVAVASGVSADNIVEQAEYVNLFLAATSVSVDEHTLDPAKIEALVDKLNEIR